MGTAASTWGSSPLTRGAPPLALVQVMAKRLIPAHAGSTRRWKKMPKDSRAHPRSRGEHSSLSFWDATCKGSSPLTRGALVPGVYTSDRKGLIPAHAGSTAWAWDRKRPAGAHPRSRGEHLPSTVERHCLPGSSPLTRGAPDVFTGDGAAERLIPAHAGSTIPAKHRRRRGRAHPRSRGEHSDIAVPGGAGVGSSPLTRGALVTSPPAPS